MRMSTEVERHIARVKGVTATVTFNVKVR